MSVVLRTCTTAYNVATAASTATGATDDAVDIAAMVYYIVAVGHSSAVRYSAVLPGILLCGGAA